MGKFRVIVAFIAAVVLMAVAGTVAQTQFVLAELKAIGAPITWSDRLAMTAADIVGFAPLYAAVIAAGFLIAFAMAGFVLRRTRLRAGPLYLAAGAVCVALMLVLMREVFFGVPLIAGARSGGGVAAQIACGALAGAAFAALTRPRKRKRRKLA